MVHFCVILSVQIPPKRECKSVQFSRSVVSDSVTPWTAARQASLSITNSWSLLKLMSIALVMPSNHLILCHPILLPPSIFPSIRVFSNEVVLWNRLISSFVKWTSWDYKTIPCSFQKIMFKLIIFTFIWKHEEASFTHLDWPRHPPPGCVGESVLTQVCEESLGSSKISTAWRLCHSALSLWWHMTAADPVSRWTCYTKQITSFSEITVKKFLRKNKCRLKITQITQL